MREKLLVRIQRKLWRFWHNIVLDNFINERFTDGEWCPQCGDYHPDQSLTIPI